MCVCSNVRSPHPQHAFASCDYLIVSHYPPPSTPVAFPKYEALPGPPFQPDSRQDSLGVGLGPCPAAERLRTIGGGQLGPGSICPSMQAPTSASTPSLPLRRERGCDLWRRDLGKRREEALGDGHDRIRGGVTQLGRGLREKWAERRKRGIGQLPTLSWGWGGGTS